MLPGTDVQGPMPYRWREVYVKGMSQVWVQENALVAGEWDTGTNGAQWYFHGGVQIPILQLGMLYLRGVGQSWYVIFHQESGMEGIRSDGFMFDTF